MIAEYTHGTIQFVVRNKATGRTENLRRNHNWYATGKDWADAKAKEQRRFRKEWNGRKWDFECLSVRV